MNLVLAGNLANYSFYLTKLLRDNGVNAELLMEKYPSKYNDPKTLEPDTTEYPHWIKFWNNHSRLWKMQIIVIMRKYDVIQASTELPIFSLFSGKPYIVFPTGADITELVFKRTLRGILLNRAYKKAEMIIYPGAFMHPYIKKLNLNNAVFLPPPWNYEKFKPIKNIKMTNKFIIFHPTYHDWQRKGNEKFLKAFIKLCHEGNDIHLITIKRGVDFEKSLELLKNPHCQGKYEVLNSAVSQSELPTLYNKSDVVVDAFTHGSTGLIGQEAMSCAKPLIQYTDEKLYKELYGEIPPIISASNEDEVFVILKKLIANRELANEIGQQSREWLLRHHNPEKIIKKYIFIYKAIINKTDPQIIKKELMNMV